MYSIELDVAHTATKSEVKLFAYQHGCRSKLLQNPGPAGGNPLYLFTSKSLDMLTELAQQILGPNFDTNRIKKN